MLSAQCILPVGGLLHLLQSHYHLIQLWIFRLPQWGGGGAVGGIFRLKKCKNIKHFACGVQRSPRRTVILDMHLDFTFGCFTHFSWVLGLPIEKVLD